MREREVAEMDEDTYCETCGDTGMVTCPGTDLDAERMCNFCDWAAEDHPRKTTCPACQP